MIDTLDRISRALTKALTLLAGLMLVAMMLLACANMVSRAVWLPIQGTFELMGFLGAVTTAFALAFAQLNKSHISVGILMKHLPRPVRRLLDALTSLISCAFFALIGSETAQWAGYLVNTGSSPRPCASPTIPLCSPRQRAVCSWPSCCWWTP
jgi:TRAP-type C4-dicarboxylate transport system permease small subunit